MRRNVTIPTELPIERAFLVGVELKRGRSLWSVEDSLAELAQLARTAGVVVVGSTIQRLEMFNPATYVGRGKVEEIAALKSDLGFDLVIFDDELSPSQQRNLEDALQTRVVDRTALILDIFAKHAHTYEGRLQVELAQYEYRLPRLTRMWTHLSRQGVGGVGLRGPGEKQLEVDRRRIWERISRLRDELEHVRTHRELYRKRRRRKAIPIVAIVGYTNAGKSTLLNALTGAEVLVEDKLFATLDPTTRRGRLPKGEEVLFTDTVGFIQKLPTQLVAAFRATLEEINEADLLLHVLDITHPNVREQSHAVEKTLRELGAVDKPMIIALNKIDLLGANPLSKLVSGGATGSGEVMRIAELYSNCVAISAKEGIGIDRLLERIEEVLSQSLVKVTTCIPYQANNLVSLFHRKGIVEEEKYTKEGTRIVGRVPRRFLGAFQRYLV